MESGCSSWVLWCWQMVTLVSLVVTGVRGDYSKTCTAAERSEAGDCGSNLADSVKLACMFTNRGYNGGLFEKKSAPPASLDDPFLSKVDALSHFTKRSDQGTAVHSRRRRSREGQNIVCECCVHHCSIRELAEYCGGSQKKRGSPLLGSYAKYKKSNSQMAIPNSREDYLWNDIGNFNQQPEDLSVVESTYDMEPTEKNKPSNKNNEIHEDSVTHRTSSNQKSEHFVPFTVKDNKHIDTETDNFIVLQIRQIFKHLFSKPDSN